MRVVRRLFCLFALIAVAAAPACSCNNQGRVGGPGGPGSDGGPPAIGSLSIDPADVTLDLVMGAAPPTASFTVTQHAADGDHDVTGQCTFTLADTTLGVMNGAVFTAGTAHGGTTSLVANLNGAIAQANIHVKVHATFSTPDCTGCTFPAPGAPACGAANTQPNVVYPLDGVLLPPNMDIITIQWMPGNGNTQFEVDLSNAATDVKINTKCAPTVDTRSQMSGGCKLDLTNAMWTFVAGSNKGGDPVKVTVQGTSDGTCAAPGANSVAMSFSEDDVAGGIYYWKSTVSAMGTGGQIWRKAFGDQTAEEQITGVGGIGGTCNGCHSLSRDGLRMVINSDDADSDDEYTDVKSGLVDVGKKAFVNPMDPQGPPGFQTFNPDHTLFLGTNGLGNGKSIAGNGFGGGGGGITIASNQFFLWDGNSAMLSNPNFATGSSTATQRVTQPDWSADGKNVVFIAPASVATWTGAHGNPNDDDHVTGGSLWMMPYLGTGMFGPPAELLHSMGENNYYPGYSPDGGFIVFNRVDMQPAPDFPNNDSFSNPKARVWVLPTAAGATPIDCAALNGSGDLSNSWPRWSPFIQTYKGSKLLWVTFSSTRDYGLLVRNAAPVNGQAQVQCYPPDSAESPGGTHGTPFPANCRQPQLWMAAINLTTAEVMGTVDPSSPPFWLPFQDITTHNHTAQWTSTVVTTPPPDGGTCLMGGEDCTKAPNNCCDTLVCTANGTCGIL